jgi:uncharacterized iron-regulated protein
MWRFTILKGLMSGVVIAVIVALAGCATGRQDFHGAHAISPHAPTPAATPAPPAEAAPALDLTQLPALKDILPALADKRVVFVGETHDRYAHHLTQLELIKAQHAAHPQLAIGLEMFQQPFQSYLDDYIAGVLSEREMLVATEYFQRWRYDYRLYAPILRYARDNRLPVVALNVDGDLVGKVRALGIDGLEAADRARLPADIDRGNAQYEARLRQIFAQHPQTEGRGFDRFLDGQLLWDEGMAERTARYLEEHPDHAMVVLAGSGHLVYGDGIPRRLERRGPVTSAIVLNGWEGELTPEVADYLLMPAPQSLPAAGRIGALLLPDKKGLKVDSCTRDSACAAAGIKRGDRVLSIDEIPVNDLSDVSAVMWDKKPGETVTLSVRRERWFVRPEELKYRIQLR